MAGDGNVKDNGKGMHQSDLLEKEVSETNFLVATLIATVTFAAALTVPGGFKQNRSVDEGLAILSHGTAFRVFLIANTLAFGLSITPLLVQFLASAMIKDVNFHRQMARRAPILTNWSVAALLVAFIAGNYTLVPQSFGITAAVILSCCFLYCLFLPLSIQNGNEKSSIRVL